MSQPSQRAFRPPLTSEQAEGLARSSGLREMGIRPPLVRYLPAVWMRRSFVWNLSKSRAYTRNQGSYLGQAWSVINPTLDAAVYIIVFGFVFGARKGIENIAAFITVGTFTYALFQRAVMAGVDAIPMNLDLVRSHQFPRAVVPAATSLTEAVLFAPALVVMVIISYLTGFLPGMGTVDPRWTWLLLPVAAVLLVIFSMGTSFFLARIGARTPDLRNVLPFFLSLGRYGSGVMFSIQSMVNPHAWWAKVLEWQPISVYLTLFRACFGNEPSARLSPQLWYWAVGWALIVLIPGFIFFWGAEKTYGRD